MFGMVKTAMAIGLAGAAGISAVNEGADQLAGGMVEYLESVAILNDLKKELAEVERLDSEDRDRAYAAKKLKERQEKEKLKQQKQQK